MGWHIDGTGPNEIWTPDCPMITKAEGKDEVSRIYIIAATEVDIDIMCHAAGIPSSGIRAGTWYNGYERIVKRHELALLKRVFP